MIPIGYVAKYVAKRPDWLSSADQVQDIYSVSPCYSEEALTDLVWERNGYGVFNSRADIRRLSEVHTRNVAHAKLFYYEAYELEFNLGEWQAFAPHLSFGTKVEVSRDRELEGFDTVSVFSQRQLGCSPLSCNLLATKHATNEHCLHTSFAEAKKFLEGVDPQSMEPGPYRLVYVYSASW